jgi:Flp pilus assembly protein TadG
MIRLRSRIFARDDEGATLVEFSLIAPLLFMLTFGIVYFGAVFYQYQALNAATAMGARIAATRGPVITGVPDCGVGVTATAGAYCSTAAASKTWAPVKCTGSSATPTSTGSVSGLACNTTLMTRILTEMQKAYPPLAISNVNVSYGPSGLGFQGLGKPVPTVTVSVTGVPASFIVISAFGLNSITLPPFTTTLPAEDLSGT